MDIVYLFIRRLLQSVNSVENTDDHDDEEQEDAAQQGHQDDFHPQGTRPAQTMYFVYYEDVKMYPHVHSDFANLAQL